MADRQNPMNDPAALTAALDALEACETADDVREAWAKHFLIVGHKRLGRLLMRRNPLTSGKIEVKTEGAEG